MPHRPASSALARFRILDLTRVRAGPSCVRQLADFGADVIKIESPPGVDPNEGMGGDRDGPDFQNLHRNKRSITLNLKTETGRAILMQLAKTADVLVENYRPDVKQRLGFDYPALKAVMMPSAANRPDETSAIAVPARIGPSPGRPVIDMKPPMPCAIWSKPGRLR